MRTVLLNVFMAALTFACSTSGRHQDNEASRSPAGFENLPTTIAGPSILYQGPFLVGQEGPERQPAKVFLPVQYDNKSSWPLVILLHGFTATGDLEDFYLGLSVRVSLRGFILAAPNGTLTPKGTKGAGGRDLSEIPFWNATDACCDFGKTQVDDAGYIARVIAEVKNHYHIDPSRIYIIGHSNGAFMANRMACEIGDQLAGVASLAGGTYADYSKCKMKAPLPYLHIHDVNDTTIGYDESKQYAGALSTIAAWVKRNACQDVSDPGPEEDFVLLIPGKDTSKRLWKRCSSGQPVALWTIKSHGESYYNPHIPLFNLEFTDRVLDFLFAHKKAD